LGGGETCVDEPFNDDEIIHVLTDAGVPVELHREFVAFQKKFGGRKDAFGLNTVCWRILHRASKWIKAGQIEA
jgi:hypothetical protein